METLINFFKNMSFENKVIYFIVLIIGFDSLISDIYAYKQIDRLESEFVQHKRDSSIHYFKGNGYSYDQDLYTDEELEEFEEYEDQNETNSTLLWCEQWEPNIPFVNTLKRYIYDMKEQDGYTYVRYSYTMNGDPIWTDISDEDWEKIPCT